MWEKLIQQTRIEVDVIRKDRGLPPWDWNKDMISEICKPCADAGHKNIIAAYKGVRAGASHDGKEIPPMCYDHKHGKVPKYIQRELDKVSAEKIAEEVEVLEEDEPEEEQDERDDDAPTKWGAFIEDCLDLRQDITTEIKLPPDGTANQARCMLAAKMGTMMYRWSVGRSNVPGNVIVTMLGRRKDVIEMRDESDESAEKEEPKIFDDDGTEINYIRAKDLVIIKELKSQGLSVPKISTQVGFTPSQIYYALRNDSKATATSVGRTGKAYDKPSKVTDEVLALVKEQNDSGVSIPAIAKELGFKSYHLYNALRYKQPEDHKSLTFEVEADGIYGSLYDSLKHMHSKLAGDVEQIMDKMEALEKVMAMIKEGASA